MYALRAQSAIARVYVIIRSSKVSLAIELDPDMEHICLASRTTPRSVRLAAHALAPQVELELLGRACSNDTPVGLGTGLYCVQTDCAT